MSGELPFLNLLILVWPPLRELFGTTQTGKPNTELNVASVDISGVDRNFFVMFFKFTCCI